MAKLMIAFLFSKHLTSLKLLLALIPRQSKWLIENAAYRLTH